MKRTLFRAATIASVLGVVIYGVGTFILTSPWQGVGKILGATLVIGGTIYVLWVGEEA